MCLYTIKTEEEIKEWLKTQPSMITAYKIVRKTPKLPTFIDRLLRRNKTRYSLRPMHYTIILKKYKKKNRIKGDRPIHYVSNHMDKKKCTNASPNVEHFKHLEYLMHHIEKPYKAYFHLWLEIPYYIGRELDTDFVLIECHVPKHLITAVGTEEVVQKATYIMETDDPKKMGTTEVEYKYIPTIVSKGFDIVKEC